MPLDFNREEILAGSIEEGDSLPPAGWDGGASRMGRVDFSVCD